jgi:hypothetical protein
MNLKNVVTTLPSFEGEGNEPAVYQEGCAPNDNYQTLMADSQHVVDDTVARSTEQQAMVVQSAASDANDAKIALTEIQPYLDSSDPVTQTFVQIAAESAFKLTGQLNQFETLSTESMDQSKVAKVIQLIDRAFPVIA